MSAIAVTAAGNLYVAESDGFGCPGSGAYPGVVRVVDLATGTISPFAGNGSAGYSGDLGPAINAEISYVSGLAVDGARNVFLCDSSNQAVREVDQATQNIYTVAGDGVCGYSGDTGYAGNAELFYPMGIAADAAGGLFVADYGNSAVREIFCVAAPAISLVCSANYAAVGQNVTFTATVGPADGIPITGSVYFYDGTNPYPLSTPTLDSTGHATFSATWLAVGTHSIKAVYSGDACHTLTATAALDVEIAPHMQASDHPMDVSPAGVVYATGMATYSVNDFGDAAGVPSSGGLAAGQRVYGSMLPASSGGVGNGWLLADQPHIVTYPGTSYYVVVVSPTETYSFQKSGSVYSGENGIQETMSQSGSVISFVRADGTVLQFNDFSHGSGSALNGQFLGCYSPSGSRQVVSATGGPNNQITRMDWTIGGASQADQEEQIAYFTSGVNSGRVASITLLRWNGSALVSVRRVDYSYYDGSTANGQTGDLQSAAEYCYDPSGVTATLVGTSFYRYTSGRMTLALSPQGYANATAALGGIYDTADTALLLPYSSVALQYNIRNQVSAATVGGLRKYSYTYGVDLTQDYSSANVWHTSCREVRPDGTAYSVFTNLLGESLLTDLASASRGQHWVNFDQYNANWQLVSAAEPSAVNVGTVSTATGEHGYDSNYADLHISLYTTAGLIEQYTYATSTTAANSTGTGDAAAGDVAGYPKAESLHHGTSDATGVPVAAYSYYRHTGNVSTGGSAVAVTIVHEATGITYRDDAGTQAIATTYHYTWYSGTVQPSEAITDLPTPTPDQNGPSTGTQWTAKYVFNSVGQLVWEEDARSRFTYHGYAPVTGLETETVADAADSPPLPSGEGWGEGTIAPPDPLPATGVNAATDYVRDSLGRVVQTLGPAFLDNVGDTVRSAAFTSYIDAPQYLPYGQGEGGTGTLLASASGFYVVSAAVGSAYATGDYVLANPISIEVSNLDGQTTDDLQGQDGPGLTIIETSSAATLGELARAAASPSSYSRWTHNDYETAADSIAGYAAGDQMDSKAYTDVTSWTFSETVYGYDSAGQQNRTLDVPSGNITRTVFDANGRTVSTWSGTNDAGATDGDPSNGGANGMKISTSNVYDGGAAGDGNLTSTTTYVDDTPAHNRVATYGYDWRDRPLWDMMNDGTYQTYRYNVYDNLGEVIESKRYNNVNKDGLAAIGASPHADDVLIGDTTSAYDDAGQVYRTQEYGVNPQTGQEDATPLVGNTWHTDGNTVKTQAAGSQEWNKTTCDGLGRATQVSVGYTVGANDLVFQQTDTQYDAAGNVIFVTSRERFTGDTADTGPLTDADSRASYVGNWYDAMGRKTDTANYGAVAAFARPNTPPARSDTVLVSSTEFDAAGNVYQTIDPAGNVVTHSYDDSGAPIPGGGANNLTGITSTYDRQGELVQTVDAAGTTHQFTYDNAGRQIADSVTAHGTGVDTSVLRIEDHYDVRGLLTSVISYNAASGGSVVNDVEMAYNHFGKLVSETQEHVGAATGASLAVGYTYNSANGSGTRQSLVYPNGRTIDFGYGDSTDTSGALGRLGSIVDDSANSSLGDATAGQTLASFSYLGLDTIVTENYQEPQLKLDYSGATLGSYSGLDQFNRVVDQFWSNYSSTPVTPVDEYRYTYNRLGNRLSKQNVVAGANNLDELYAYDAATQQLTGLAHGRLNAARDALVSGTQDFSQGWTLDAAGNWSNFTQTGGGQSAIYQDRQVNGTNQIQNYNDAGGSSTSNWIVPVYDGGRNMTVMPQPGNETLGVNCVYDAWNRLVSATAGGVTATYSYDGDGRMVERTQGTATTHYYYAGQQVVETRAGLSSVAPQALPPQYQYVWSPIYVDAPVLRDSYNSSGAMISTGRIYYLTDANHSVSAVAGTSGSVIERYVYDAYGKVTVCGANWVPTGQPSSVNNTLLYTGRPQDPTTDLYYDRARWYNSSLGTFTAQDPLGLGGGDANLYRYGKDSPVNASDPTGEASSGGGGAAKAYIKVTLGSCWNTWFAGTWGQPFMQAVGGIDFVDNSTSTPWVKDWDQLIGPNVCNSSSSAWGSDMVNCGSMTLTVSAPAGTWDIAVFVDVIGEIHGSGAAIIAASFSDLTPGGNLAKANPNLSLSTVPTWTGPSTVQAACAIRHIFYTSTGSSTDPVTVGYLNVVLRNASSFGRGSNSRFDGNMHVLSITPVAGSPPGGGSGSGS